MVPPRRLYEVTKPIKIQDDTPIIDNYTLVEVPVNLFGTVQIWREMMPLLSVSIIDWVL